MPAVYINYDASDGADLFNFQGDMEPLVRIKALSASLDNMSSNDIVLITDIQFSEMETMQFFPTFDEVIRYVHFGAALGMCNVSGVVFPSCSGQLSGLAKIQSYYSSHRGKEDNISLGDASFVVVLDGKDIQATAEPLRQVAWTLRYKVIGANNGQ